MHASQEDPLPSHAPERGRPHHAPAARRDLGVVIIVLRATCERDPLILEDLARCGLRVCVVPGAEHVLAVVRSLAPAVVLLDLRSGDAGALAACPQIKRTRNVRMVVLADETADAGSLGVELGPDELLGAPASARDVAARIRAIVRRSSHVAGPVGGGLVLDEHRSSATLDGRALDLTPAEFRLLALLVAAGDRVLSRSEILAALGSRDHASERSVDSLVHHLRRKLAAVRPGEKLIRSTYGAGYSLRI